MATDWDVSTVGEVAHVVTKGTTPTTAGGAFVPCGVNFVKVESISADGVFLRDKFAYIDEPTHALQARSQLQEDDVLFTIAGTIGRSVMVGPQDLPANTNQAVAIVRPDKSKIDPRFLFYVLRDEQRIRGAQSRVVQSVQANFSLGELKSVEVPIPSLKEQRRIAHILGTLDDKIELNRRMNKTLEEMARALFKSWFVDFDPVRAKAEGRDTGLPTHLADLFPDRLADSELGEIPEGWGVAPIGAIASIVGGSTPSTKVEEYWVGGNVPFATPRDLAGLASPVLQSTERRITNAGLAHIGSGLLPAGTVLMSSRAPIGYLAITNVGVAINQGFIAMAPVADASNIFLLLWAQHAQPEVVARANGSTFLEISKSSFREISVIEPPTSILLAFEARTRPLLDRISVAATECTALIAQRDELLGSLLGASRPMTQSER